MLVVWKQRWCACSARQPLNSWPELLRAGLLYQGGIGLDIYLFGVFEDEAS